MKSRSRYGIVGAATLAALLSTAAISSAFADVPGTDEGRNLVIASVEAKAAAAQGLAAQQQAKPVTVTTTGVPVPQQNN
ncbi:MAG TPA: hypothetical protein VGG27_12480 [Magnetospirillaceae bacterium]